MIKLKFHPFGTVPDVPDPTPDPALDNVLSLQEAADLLGYSARMINHLWATQKLPGARKGRCLVFHRATILEYGRQIETTRRNMGKAR